MADARFKKMIRNKTFREILQRNGFKNSDVLSSVALSTLSILLDENGNLRTIDAQGNPVIISIEGANDSYYNAGAKTGPTTFDHALGSKQKATLTGNVDIAAPSNGTEGSELTLWLTPTGANRDLNFDGAIQTASDSGLVLPKTLTQDALYIVKLVYNGTNWMLVSLVGGF